MKTLWREFLEYARFTPSPNNTQPWKFKIISESEAELYYDPTRLLPIEDSKNALTICSLSMFVDTLSLAASHEGFKVKADFLAKELDAKKSAPTLFAKLHLVKSEEDFDFDRRLIIERRTSRLNYDSKMIDQDVVNELIAIAKKYGHEFYVKSDPVTVKSIMDLNRQTIFYDMTNPEIRNEMKTWFRFSDSEVLSKKDGLWFKCMNIPSYLLGLFFNQESLFEKEPFKSLLLNFYERTMKGTVTVGWLRGPFTSFDDYINAGVLFNRFWLELAKHKIYIHPFGSLITNPLAHEEFIKKMEITEGSSKVWLILRLGYSETPSKSPRLEVTDILI